MPTILELFESKELNFPGGTTADGLVDASAEENRGGFKQQVKNFVQQETTGIRIKSLVDVNNPLIYGNQAVRIAQRTTPDKDAMLESVLGKETGGGLNSIIGKARDAVNSVLGIPETPLPSRVIALDGKQKAIKGSDVAPINMEKHTTNIPITKEGYGKNGSALGALLKSSGGNPSTIGKQALGGGIGMAKDKLRGALFGQPRTIGDAIGDNNGANLEYHNENTYTQVMTDTSKPNSRDIFNEGGEQGDTPIPFANKSLEKLDLSLVSPVYGLDRKKSDGKFGKGIYALQIKQGKDVVKTPSGYSPQKKYSDLDRNKGSFDWIESTSWIGGSSLADDNGKYKVGSKEKTKSDLEKYDLVPFWIAGLDSNKALFFKCVVSGLSETTSPQWQGSKFVGNPYNYYTYDGVERAVTFNFNIYCTSAAELSSNWEKITSLTRKTYPNIKDNISNPPFITFRIGDMYNGKIGFIESLTYTFPDNGTWETTLEGQKLPKFIDVALTIKLVETPGSEHSLYSYLKSEEAIEAIKEETSQSEESVSGAPQTGEAAKAKVTVNNKTGEVTSEPEKEGGSGTTNLQGDSEETPKELTAEEKRAVAKAKYAAEQAKRLEEVKAKGIDPELHYLAKSLARDSEVDIPSITKINETTWSYDRKYLRWGSPAIQKMIGESRGPSSASSTDYNMWVSTNSKKIAASEGQSLGSIFD